MNHNYARMNPMNQMNPSGASMCSKNFFSMDGGRIWAFWGSSRFIGSVLGCFWLITINKLLKISSLDEPNVHG